MTSITCELFNTNVFIHNTEIDSQIQKTNYGYQTGRRGQGYVRSLGLTDRIDKQQGPIG